MHAASVKNIILPVSIKKVSTRMNGSLCLVFQNNTQLDNLLIDRASTTDFDSIMNDLNTKNVKINHLELMMVESSNKDVTRNVLKNVNRLDTYSDSWSKKYNFEFLDALKDVDECSIETFRLYYSDRINLDFLSKLSSLKTLIVGTSDVSNIDGIQNLKRLEDISLTGNKITDITALTNLVKCKNLILNNNKISSVLPLSNMNELVSLEIENNAIYDTSYGQSNLEVLANLNKFGKLKTLKIAGNFFTNFDLVSNLNWTDWSGFNNK